MMGIERPLEGSDDFALDGERFAWNARAGCRRVATATELRGDFIHVYLLAL